MQSDAGKLMTNSQVTFSNGLLHMNTSIGQPVKIYMYQLYANNGYCLEDLLEWWLIGTDGERGSKKSVLLARHDYASK